MSLSSFANARLLPLHEEEEEEPTGDDFLVDAEYAGGDLSHECTLILTERDSAMVLGLYGINCGTVDQNYYGVFPLGNKLLNVREASDKQIMEDAEIQHLQQILGLELGKVYDSAKSLRYGHLMIMTNQNHDGIHIKGLLINLIHLFWPSLLKIPSFLGEFIIPKVEATHRDGQVLSFYNNSEYESWKKSLGGEKNWTIDYYEGLSARNKKEANKYFRSLETHKKFFTWVDERDGDAIDMVFSKEKIEARKTWLRQYEPGTYLDRKKKLIKYSDFVNKELILIFLADLHRFIPSMVDGLKLDQRKILFCAFHRNLVTNINVDEFSAYVTRYFGYHPCEIARNIVGMAQDFVGSNNINLFTQRGQFGTRYQEVDFEAITRCISTSLAPIARLLFPEYDDTLLENLKENRRRIEPIWYAPVIPLVLVNGSEGSGAGGCSTFVPNYNPRDLCTSVRSLLRGDQMMPIHPWYKGFQRTIEKTTIKESGTSYTSSGKIDQIDDTTLSITELPIGMWTLDYKRFLATAQTRVVIGADKIELFFKEYYEERDPTKVGFKIIMSKENLRLAKEEEGLAKEFKLTTTISTGNMLLFDQNGAVKKYDNPEQIIEEFFKLRLDLYKIRREMLLEDLSLEISKLSNAKRFISCVLNNEINFFSDIDLELQNKGFEAFQKKKKKKSIDAIIVGIFDCLEQNEESCLRASDNSYEYLMSMGFPALRKEKVMELESQINNLTLQLQELKDSTPETLWMKDLDALEQKLNELDEAAPDDSSSMETAMILAGKVPSRKTAPSKWAAVQKQPTTTLTEISDAGLEEKVEVVAAPQLERKKGGKAAKAKVVKPFTETLKTTRKRSRTREDPSISHEDWLSCFYQPCPSTSPKEVQ